MKKTMSIFMLIVMLISFCSCAVVDNQTESDVKTVLNPDNTLSNVTCDPAQNLKNLILEVDSGFYDSLGDNIERKNLISDKIEHYFDSNATPNKVFNINSAELSLKYDESLKYPVGDMTLDQYLLDGDKDKKIILKQDGKLKALLYEFETIDFLPTSLVKDIRPLLEDKLASIIDLTKFQYLKKSCDDDSVIDRVCNFLYYNMVDGYMTDFARLAVYADGQIGALVINDLESENLDFKVDKETERKLLSEKIKDVYETTIADKEYISYRESENITADIVKYEGQLYVRHYVSARVNYMGSEMEDWMRCFLVPLDLITVDAVE